MPRLWQVAGVQATLTAPSALVLLPPPSALVLLVPAPHML
jgi:hypothetical protein